MSTGGERGAVITVALAAMLAPLNSTMIAVALPWIGRDFGLGVSQAGWLVTAYLIAMASLQPVAGKLGDRTTRRGLILGGVALFGLASLGAALAAGFAGLLFFRVLQAIAGAVALPNATALLREVVPEERRASRFGQVGAAVALAAAAGPPLGGLVVGAAGWRALFLFNLLLSGPALLLGWRFIPAKTGRVKRTPFDLTGALLLSVLLTVTAGLFTRSPVSSLPLGAILACLTALFLVHEWRHPDPVLQIRFFARRAFASANAAIALSNLAMYSTLLAVPLLLSRFAGWKSAGIGFVLAAMSVGMVIASPLGGRLADRLGRRTPTVAGLVLLAAGLVPFAAAGGSIHVAGMLAGLSLAGIGLGLSMTGLQTAAIEAVGVGEAGVAAGIFSTSRYLGSIVGSSLLSGVMGTASAGDSALKAFFLTAAIAALVSALVSYGLPGHSDRPAGSARISAPAAHESASLAGGELN